jgi:aldose 1-epimerase
MIKEKIFVLKNSAGIEAKVTNYGGILMSLTVPDRNAVFENIVLGFDNIADYQSENYLEENPYMGAIVGRYANVLKDARFSIDGTEYKLQKNFGNHCLHGGIKGFDKVVWEVRAAKRVNASVLQLSYLSKDGEEGFPGNVQATVTYELTNDNKLVIKYTAVSDKKTPLNLTNHSYFNLNGTGNGDILGHELRVNADAFVEFDRELVPTGRIRMTRNTPMDFAISKTIAVGINDKYDQLQFADGYDVTYVLSESNNINLLPAASLFHPGSGRFMEVFTTMPGLHLYTGNSLNERIKQGYVPRSGICLETQYFPDSPNHSLFPCSLMDANEKYNHTTIFKFSIKE